jgi:predicted RND superfamily exporter protein
MASSRGRRGASKEIGVYRLTRLSLTYPKLTLLVVGLVTAVLGVGLTRLRTEFGYRVLIGDSHPSVVTLDRMIERFGGGLPIQIAWECGEGHPCDNVFDGASLRMADSVTRALAPLSGILEVQGPSNADLLVPAEDGFAIRRFVEDGQPVPDARALAARAVEDPLRVDTLISADAAVGVIVVQSADTKSETDARVVGAIEAALAPFEAQGFEFHLAGEAISTIIPGRELAESTARLIPFTVLVIALVLFTLSRSWQSVAVAVGTMGIALLWTFGLLGWLDWPQDGILEVLAPLILVVGVCDAIHLLSVYSAAMAGRVGAVSAKERSGALVEAARDVGAPCLITTLTTAVAFLSFVTSALDTFVRFGCIAAFGTAACLLLTFSLLPLTVRILPAGGIPAVRASRAWSSALDAIVRTCEKRTLPILSVGAALFVLCAIGWLGYLRVDTNWYESFGEQSRIIRWVRFLEDRVRPPVTLELEIELPPESRIEDPATLREIADFSEFLSAPEEFWPLLSILDPISRLNRVLHGDDPEFERPGDTAEANAELIELVAFDNPTVLASWLSLDRSAVRISVGTPWAPHSERGRVLESIREYIDAELPPSWKVTLSGAFAINFDWVNDVQGTQLRSFPTAFLLVLVMVALFLGSLRLGLAAMVPTLLPVVVTLGAMGWIGMSLDVGRAMIAAVLIGIGVDDSIHLLHQYAQQRAAGESPQEAIRGAVRHVGRAVVTTSVALSLGFLTLMASAWQTIASFGFFVSLAILGALAASLFVLPALIFAFGRSE